MIVGDPSVFAIESHITEAYQRPSQLALGFFVIHVSGFAFGVRTTDATMLACSYEAVLRRMDHRGKHIAPFANELAGEIADAFRNAVYGEELRNNYFGLTHDQFSSFFEEPSTDLIWAPDGDEAFDDGSYVLQFDVGQNVRLIAFRTFTSGAHDPRTLVDTWLAADDYYDALKRWREAFKSEWESLRPR